MPLPLIFYPRRKKVGNVSIFVPYFPVPRLLLAYIEKAEEKENRYNVTRRRGNRSVLNNEEELARSVLRNVRCKLRIAAPALCPPASFLCISTCGGAVTRRR